MAPDREATAGGRPRLRGAFSCERWGERWDVAAGDMLLATAVGAAERIGRRRFVAPQGGDGASSRHSRHGVAWGWGGAGRHGQPQSNIPKRSSKMNHNANGFLLVISTTSAIYLGKTLGGDLRCQGKELPGGGRRRRLVYFGSADHKLYAFNATDGSFKWAYATGARVHSSHGVVCVMGSINHAWSCAGVDSDLSLAFSPKMEEAQSNFVVL